MNSHPSLLNSTPISVPTTPSYHHRHPHYYHLSLPTIKERGTNITIEFRGAVATFLTMAYILAVNPRLLSNSGGTCKADDYGGNPYDPGYTACMEEVKRQMIVATAITSMFACLLMGLWANLPIALSCGMGMNAYFTYNIVGNRGEYDVSYEAALTAVLIEGIVFFILAITGARYWIIKTIFPDPVRHACPAAIGFFLAHLGLQTAEGIGLVVGDIVRIYIKRPSYHVCI